MLYRFMYKKRKSKQALKNSNKFVFSSNNNFIDIKKMKKQ